MRQFTALLVMLLLAPALLGQEICNNGIDDDGDGLIDLNDPDCECLTLVAPPDVQSHIRNHSFEDRTCCPLSFVAPPWTPPWLSCAVGWAQATAGTSDYFHMCGYAPPGTPMPPPDGEGAVGIIVGPTYREFVGTCLTYPLPAQPLLADSTYTLSFWLAGVAIDGQIAQSEEQGRQFAALFPDSLPIAVFGFVEACQAFPVQTSNCLEDVPGWIELGRAWVRPAWEWQRVPITFTLTDEIHSIILGAPCDMPSSFGGANYVDSEGNVMGLLSYLMIDELLLTVAREQALLPVASSGNICMGNVLAVGDPPPGATGYQWYLDGVALSGETGLSLDVSGGGYGPGVYTMATTYEGECLMGSTTVAAPLTPQPILILEPGSGCAPLTVAFADTSGHTMVHWDLGDGTTGSDSAWVHTYTQPGTYDVEVTVVNAAGCTGSITLPDAVTVYPPANGSISITPNPVDVGDPHVLLQGTGPGDIVSWSWDLGDGDPPTSDAASLNATFPGPGEYPISLVVTTSDGCVDTVWAVVRVVEHGDVEMPNVFSPNGDGHNDRFVPLEAEKASGLLEIYNRWGQRIFSTRNLRYGWDGHDAPGGTYFYIVTPDDPEAVPRAGHVMLLR